MKLSKIVEALEEEKAEEIPQGTVAGSRARKKIKTPMTMARTEPDLAKAMEDDPEDEVPMPTITKSGEVPVGAVVAGKQQERPPRPAVGEPVFSLPHHVAVDVAAAAREMGLEFDKEIVGPGEWKIGPFYRYNRENPAPPEAMKKLFQYVSSKMQQAKTAS